MTCPGMSATSSERHYELKTEREKNNETKVDETLILILEEENAVEAV